jgi:hypothetical protein
MMSRTESVLETAKALRRARGTAKAQRHQERPIKNALRAVTSLVLRERFLRVAIFLLH